MSKSVWDDIEPDPAKAEVLKARSALMMRLQKAIKAWDVSQEDAAKRLGVSRPRLSDLMRGKFAKFNFETLHLLSIRAGLQTVIHTKAAKVRTSRGRKVVRTGIEAAA